MATLCAALMLAYAALLALVIALCKAAARADATATRMLNRHQRLRAFRRTQEGPA